MAEKIQLEVEIKGGESVAQASGKVENLRTKLKALKQQLASGELSADEFNKISKQAGELDDRLKDVNARVKNLGSDTRRLDGFVSIAQGIAGGFAAAQGAVALFGDENKDLQKTLVKVQGAVALLSGVQAVANILQKESAAMLLINTTRTNILAAAQARYTAVVGTTTGALKALRIVGATLGIGLIVAAIALLIAKFKDIKEVVGKFLPSLTAVANGFKAVWNAITDFIGVTSDATREVDRLREANQKSFKQQENEIELMKAKGATISQIYLAERKLMMDKIADLDLILKAGKKLSEEEIKQREEAVQGVKVLDATYTKDRREELAKQSEDQKKASEDARKKRIEAAKQRKQDEKTAIAEELKIAEEREDILGTLTLDRQRYYLQKRLEAGLISQAEFTNAMLKSAKEEAEAEKVLADQQVSDLTNQLFAEVEAEQDAYDLRLQQQKEYNDAVIEAEQSLNDAKRGALEAGFNIAQAFTQKNKALSNVLFAIQKGVAIAQVIVDTQKEIAGYYSNPTWSALPDGGATIKTAYATGAKIRAATSIATIGATAIGRLAGQSAGGTGGGSGVPTGNQPNIQGYSTNNQPNQQTGQSGNMRVYVTETDIRNATRKINGIYSQATVE